MHLHDVSELFTGIAQGSTAHRSCHLCVVSDWRLVTFTSRFPLLFASASGSTKSCPSAWHLQPDYSTERRLSVSSLTYRHSPMGRPSFSVNTQTLLCVKRERKPTRCNNQMFIINFCLNMFRASSCPSSAEQRPCVTA